ncbi:MAG: AAA family ATPase [Lachnospiraceae bacterium]|nr:AAA family ATPase [Lachnospiraceae bacterium]
MEVTAAVKGAVYTGNRSLADRVNGYLFAAHGSITDVAREIGYSRTTVSRYLSGKYDSDPTDIETRLSGFLASRTKGDPVPAATAPVPAGKTGSTPAFYESRDAKAVLGVCQSCQEYTGLGIVVARSGYGKTYALRQYAKLPRVAYIECDDTMGCRDLVEAIEHSLGLPGGYGTIWRRVSGIREFFNTNRGYLLVIDEADKLVSKYTQKKMEILRAVFDQSDVGLVIAGEPRLEAQIKTYLARMANRVDFYASLRGLSPSEVEGYLEGFDVTPDALVELKARACNMQTGCFRLLDRTLSNVRRILAERGDTTVTVKIIEQASSMMML